jgi:MYXO-CTERM domain-containing protein
MDRLSLKLRAVDRRRVEWGIPTVVATVAITLSLASPAQAELGRLAWSGTSLFCGNLAPCSTAGAFCDTGPGGVAVTCEILPNGQRACSPFEGGFGEVFCCTSDADCGGLDGVPGTCDFIRDGISVCSWPEVFDFCGGETTDLTRDAVVNCVKLSVDGDAPVDWAKGDCDEDGIYNDVDECPCEAGDGCFFEPDAGVPDAGWDAGIDDFDAGIDDFDAGVVEVDAGPVEPPPPPPERDAGPEPPPGMDAGYDTTGVSFTGDGGCSVSSTEQTSAPWLVALALLGLVARRRR